MKPVVPRRYKDLVGRIFTDIGLNGMSRTFRVDEICYLPSHHHGPWLAKCYPWGWNPPFKGARYRSVNRFLDPDEYREVPHWDGEYEAPNGDMIRFYRCDGALICFDCWKTYSSHPNDEREECLTVLCNGWRVKL